MIISRSTGVAGGIFLRPWLLTSLVYSCYSQSSSQVNVLHTICLSTWGLCLSCLWLDFNLAKKSMKPVSPHLHLTLDLSPSFLDHSRHTLTQGHICPTSRLVSQSQELSCKKSLEGVKFVFISLGKYKGWGWEKDLLVNHVITVNTDIHDWNSCANC